VRIEVEYAGWHVGDGDRPIQVGRPWRATLALRPEASDGRPDERVGCEPADDREPTLERVPERGGLRLTSYAFVADAVFAEDHRFAGPWTAVEFRGLRFAVPGLYGGRIAGSGALFYDTYEIDAERMVDAVTQDLMVHRIRYFRSTFRHVPGPDGGSFENIGHEDPVEVSDTREISTFPSGTFLVEVDVPDVFIAVAEPREKRRGFRWWRR
jgi:hypothetical protein